MASGRSEEFRREAVRLASTGGPTRPRVAADPGVGLPARNSERIRATGPGVSRERFGSTGAMIRWPAPTMM